MIVRSLTLGTQWSVSGGGSSSDICDWRSRPLQQTDQRPGSGLGLYPKDTPGGYRACNNISSLPFHQVRAWRRGE